jgi:hypothetical protein
MRSRVPRRGTGADGFVVCAEQRVVREGSSPSDARMRSVISEGGSNASPAGRDRSAGGQGAHREVGSEGYEEKYRAVVEGATPKTNRSAKGGTRSSLHYGGEGALIHPPHQGVCGRHDMEEQHVTSGELMQFAGGTAISGPISESEKVSEAVSVVGLSSSTSSVAKAA